MTVDMWSKLKEMIPYIDEQLKNFRWEKWVHYLCM